MNKTSQWKYSREFVKSSQALYEPLLTELSTNRTDILLIDFITLSAFDVAEKLNVGEETLCSWETIEFIHKVGSKLDFGFHRFLSLLVIQISCPINRIVSEFLHQVQVIHLE